MLHVAGIPGDPIGDPGLSTSVPADVQDLDGAVLVIEAIHQLFPWLRHLFVLQHRSGTPPCASSRA